MELKQEIQSMASGKHEYRTGIPDGMSKQEFIEWALEDIIVEVDENTDIIASWLTTPKDCKCPSTSIMRESLSKLIDRYDFAIFDCEFDLKYLNSLVDYPINEAIIVSPSNESGIILASKIADFSKKYATDAQLGVILNKVQKENLNDLIELLNTLELDLLGMIDEYENIDYDVIANKLEALYPRMNLPQIELG